MRALFGRTMLYASQPGISSHLALPSINFLVFPSKIFSLPLPILFSHMNAGGRARRRELVDEAYNLQVKAGIMARRTPSESSQIILCSAVNTSKATRL